MRFFKNKNILRKKHRILITDNRWSRSGQSIIGLIETYFKKYGFEYNMVEHSDNHIKNFYYYEIEIPYELKVPLETLLYKVFRYENIPMTLNQYERWLKMRKIKQKVLDI